MRQHFKIKNLIDKLTQSDKPCKQLTTTITTNKKQAKSKNDLIKKKIKNKF